MLDSTTLIFSHADDMIAYGPWFEAASRFCVLRHFTRSMAPSVLNGVEVKEAAHVSDFRRIDVCMGLVISCMLWNCCFCRSSTRRAGSILIWTLLRCGRSQSLLEAESTRRCSVGKSIVCFKLHLFMLHIHSVPDSINDAVFMAEKNSPIIGYAVPYCQCSYPVRTDVTILIISSTEN